MSKFQKRHYEEIADTFRVYHNRLTAQIKHQGGFRVMGDIMESNLKGKKQLLDEIIAEFADGFERDNPNFNQARFIAAIYGGE